MGLTDRKRPIRDINSMRALAIFLILLVSSIILIWYFFFFDNVVTEGEAYGLTIGMQKNDAVIILKHKYGDKHNKLILMPSAGGFDVRNVEYTSTNEFTANDVIGKDVWSIQFDGKETNVLILFFSNGKLVELHRYRRAFIP